MLYLVNMTRNYVFQLHTGQGEGTTVHTVQTLTDAQGEGMTVDLNAVTEASINQDGQIILTSEDGHGKQFKTISIQDKLIIGSIGFRTRSSVCILLILI